METIKGNIELEMVPSKIALPISLHNQVKNRKIFNSFSILHETLSTTCMQLTD